METLPFQITYTIDGDTAVFTADGDASDEHQLDLFRELESFLRHLRVEYEFEDYGTLVTEPCSPAQSAFIRTRFHRYLQQ